MIPTKAPVYDVCTGMVVLSNILEGALPRFVGDQSLIGMFRNRCHLLSLGVIDLAFHVDVAAAISSGIHLSANYRKLERSVSIEMGNCLE